MDLKEASIPFFRKELAQRDIKVEKSDFNIDNMLTTMRQYLSLIHIYLFAAPLHHRTGYAMTRPCVCSLKRIM